MQATENEKEQQLAPGDSQGQPLSPVQEEDDPEVIFAKAVAEIDTQPLIQKKAPYTVAYFCQDAFCLTMICIGIAGIIWQSITYPHMLVVLFTKAHPASITVTLDVPTRTVAPVTITRSATRPTTGTGYQKARVATGRVTFYNGLSTGQTIPAGTVLTGRDGVQIVTTQDAVIPAADSSTTPPIYGYTTVYAQAVRPGTDGNIAAFDMNGSCCAPSVIVKNLAAFTNGQDQKTFKAVAANDLTILTSTVTEKVTLAFTTAFALHPGEEAQPTTCTTKATPTHQVGEETRTVMLTIAKTCSAVAYNQSQLIHAATAAFTRTRPGAHYHIVGSVHITLQRLTPLAVAISGKWAYTFSQGYQDFLAEHIQGERPAQARGYLLRTGVISYASIPAQLPAAMYINFVVLVA